MTQISSTTVNRLLRASRQQRADCCDDFYIKLLETIQSAHFLDDEMFDSEDGGDSYFDTLLKKALILAQENIDRDLVSSVPEGDMGKAAIAAAILQTNFTNHDDFKEARDMETNDSDKEIIDQIYTASEKNERILDFLRETHEVSEVAAATLALLLQDLVDYLDTTVRNIGQRQDRSFALIMTDILTKRCQEQTELGEATKKTLPKPLLR